MSDEIIIQVPENFDHGWISKSGKYFVYRVKGSYLNNVGTIMGEEGKYSGHLRIKLPDLPPPRQYFCGHVVFKSEVVKYDFEDLIFPAVKIKV